MAEIDTEGAYDFGEEDGAVYDTYSKGGNEILFGKDAVDKMVLLLK